MNYYILYEFAINVKSVHNTNNKSLFNVYSPEEGPMEAESSAE